MTDLEILKRIHEINIAMLTEFDGICKKHHIEYYVAYGTLLGAVRHKGIIPWDDDIDIWMTREQFEKFCKYRNELGSDYELIQPEDYGRNRHRDMLSHLQYKKAHVVMDEELCNFYGNHFNRINLDIFFLDQTCHNIFGTIQCLELLLLYSMMNAYNHPKVLHHYSFPLGMVYACLRGIGHLIPLEWMRKRAAKVATRYDHSPKATHCFDSTAVATLMFNMQIPRENFSHPVYADFESLKVPIPNGADEVLKIRYGDYMKLPPAEEQIPHFGFFEQDFISPQNFHFDDE